MAREKESTQRQKKERREGASPGLFPHISLWQKRFIFFDFFCCAVVQKRRHLSPPPPLPLPSPPPPPLPFPSKLDAPLASFVIPTASPVVLRREQPTGQHSTGRGGREGRVGGGGRGKVGRLEEGGEGFSFIHSNNRQTRSQKQNTKHEPNLEQWWVFAKGDNRGWAERGRGRGGGGTIVATERFNPLYKRERERERERGETLKGRICIVAGMFVVARRRAHN